MATCVRGSNTVPVANDKCRPLQAYISAYDACTHWLLISQEDCGVSLANNKLHDLYTLKTRTIRFGLLRVYLSVSPTCTLLRPSVEYKPALFSEFTVQDDNA